MAVHLGEELVQGLLPLVIAAHAGAVPLFADGVDFVDKDDAGGLLLGLFEEVPDLSRTHAHEHLHELRTGDGEEGHLGLAGHSLGQQGLAGARRSHQQRTLGQLGPDLGVFFRVVEEVHDLGKGLLGLLLAGHIGECDPGLGFGVDLGPRFAEGHGVAGQAAAHPLHHLAGEQLPDENKEHDGQHPAH